MRRIIARHPDDDPLNGSLNDYHEFKRHVCWLDIKKWIEDRISLLREKLETAKTMEEVRAYQESLKHLRDLLDVPDLFIEELEGEELLKEQEEEQEQTDNQ